MVFPQHRKWDANRSVNRLESKYFRYRRNFCIALAHQWLNPAWRLLLRSFKLLDPSPASSWRNGVLIGNNHVGDVLCLTGSLPILNEILPDCRWDIYLPGSSCDILRGNPYVAGVIKVIHRRNFLDLWGKVRVQMVERKYDVILSYDSSGLWMDLILALSLRIPNRIGFAHKGFSAWTNIHIPPPSSDLQTFAGSFRSLLLALGTHVGLDPERLEELNRNLPLTPQLFPTSYSKFSAEAAWKSLGIPSHQMAILCFPKSRQTQGVWPSWHIIRTLRELQAFNDSVIIFSGSSSEAEELRKLQSELGVPSFILTTNLLETACIMQKCRAVVSTDSGPRHMANAMGVPVFFFRNIWFPKGETKAYCANEVDLTDDEQLIDVKDEWKVWEKHDPKQVAKKIAEHLVNG